MGGSCYGRRLSELLQEQQEPFLLRASAAEACRRRLLGFGFCHRGAGVTKRRALGGVRRALLASCFSCGARESFRRQRCAGDIGDCDLDTEFDDDDEECARKLSPVSVLELHSDEESSAMRGDYEDDKTPSTSGKSSPPQDLDFTFYEAGKICKTETGEDKTTMKSSCRSMEEQHMIISSWERIAGDISRIPMLVQLDLSCPVEQWKRLMEEEASQVGASIEAMIFEEMRGEAVRDMLA
ncbi:hypothetical protein GUJ93_ZPchr0012g21475 [Zizania palustris]|uniref:Uncharacterized protein n=1 Tax=Zizania palustris TaxID=103762 RepID=A0A8J5WJH3_ZIZPA|nr:hypothetical protein GUJ93_ZPchr0012g21475 [Zizania palustris]